MALGDVGVAVVGLLRVFVRQFQEQQVGELLQVWQKFQTFWTREDVFTF